MDIDIAHLERLTISERCPDVVVDILTRHHLAGDGERNLEWHVRHRRTLPTHDQTFAHHEHPAIRAAWIAQTSPHPDGHPVHDRARYATSDVGSDDPMLADVVRVLSSNGDAADQLDDLLSRHPTVPVAAALLSHPHMTEELRDRAAQIIATASTGRPDNWLQLLCGNPKSASHLPGAAFTCTDPAVAYDLLETSAAGHHHVHPRHARAVYETATRALLDNPDFAARHLRCLHAAAIVDPHVCADAVAFITTHRSTLDRALGRHNACKPILDLGQNLKRRLSALDPAWPEAALTRLADLARTSGDQAAAHTLLHHPHIPVNAICELTPWVPPFHLRTAIEVHTDPARIAALANTVNANRILLRAALERTAEPTNVAYHIVTSPQTSRATRDALLDMLTGPQLLELPAGTLTEMPAGVAGVLTETLLERLGQHISHWELYLSILVTNPDLTRNDILAMVDATI